jgi:hypothetical protein
LSNATHFVLYWAEENPILALREESQNYEALVVRDGGFVCDAGSSNCLGKNRQEQTSRAAS